MLQKEAGWSRTWWRAGSCDRTRLLGNLVTQSRDFR